MDSIFDFIKNAENKYKQIQDIIVEEMDNKSIECVAEIQANTRVKTGNLRRSMKTNETVKKGNVYSKDVGSDRAEAPYAQVIENGMITSQGNIRLGDHMIENGIDLYQGELNESIQSRIENEVFK